MQGMIVKIGSDGLITFVYKDGHPGLTLGKAEIKRASDVRYENGAWRIFLKKETIKNTDNCPEEIPEEVNIGRAHNTRAGAISEEVAILNTLLSLDEIA